MNFLHLPSVVQRQMFCVMNPRDIVLLAFCSARMKRMIKEARIKMTMNHIVWLKGKKGLRLYNDIVFSGFDWVIHHERCAEAEKQFPKRFKIKVGTKLLYCWIYGSGEHEIWMKGNKKDLLCVVEWLEGLFQCPKLKLGIETEAIGNLEEFLSCPKIQSVEDVFIFGWATWDQLIVIHDLMTSSDRLVVKTKSVMGRLNRRGKLFPGRLLFFLHSERLTRDHLLRLDTVKIAIFMNTTLKTEDLIAFVKQWMDSDNTTLVSIGLLLKRSTRNRWNEDAIRREFPLQPWDPQRRGPFFKHDKILLQERLDNKRRSHGYADVREGLDMERSDGLLATLHLNKRSLFMFVWHDRFPEYPAQWDTLLTEQRPRS